jgi:hypothetical protein
MRSQPARPYHHGDLQPALLRAAVEAIGHTGPAAMSLREVARRAGVSHAAAAYHFGDKAGPPRSSSTAPTAPMPGSWPPEPPHGRWCTGSPRSG